MENQELQLPKEESEFIGGRNTEESMEPPMNGGKKSRTMRKSRKPKNGKKKKGSSMKKGTTMKKKGGALKKSLNGLAVVGALFGAQQLYARKNKKALKKSMKKRSSKRSKK